MLNSNWAFLLFFTCLTLATRLLLCMFSFFWKWFKAENFMDYLNVNHTYIPLFDIVFLFTGSLDLLAKHSGEKNQRDYQVSIMAKYLISIFIGLIMLLKHRNHNNFEILISNGMKAWFSFPTLFQMDKPWRKVTKDFFCMLHSMSIKWQPWVTILENCCTVST